MSLFQHLLDGIPSQLSVRHKVSDDNKKYPAKKVYFYNYEYYISWCNEIIAHLYNLYTSNVDLDSKYILIAQLFLTKLNCVQSNH